MLENLNRIFGACFPPLVILGWLGTGIFLYTAFHSGEWRKKLTGAEGFLALLLLFMMANRIPNPAIISFRYVIGIGVLTLFWSVWLLRWGWHNCPASLRRWRGMLLLALTFGICLGGFLKEIRLSRRTRMETEAIRYFQSLPQENLTGSVIVTPEKRLERLLTTAERRGTVLRLPYDSESWKAGIRRIGPHYRRILLFLPWNMEGTELVGKLAAFKGFQWIPEYTGKYFHVFSVTVSERPVTAFRTEDMVMEDHFEQLWEISVDHPVMRNLQKRGVAFARQALRFPVGWQPNDGHGYDRGDLKNLVLKTVPNGSVGHSISFSGWGGGAIMTQRQFRADRGYWLLLGFRGTGASRIGVYLYCYDENGGFLKTEAVRYFCGTSIDFEQNEALLIEQFPAGTAKFTLALELVDGHLLLDRVFLREY